jgi:hypothetical protein
LVPGIKVNVLVLTNREVFVEKTKREWEPLQAGATLDLGDIRVKAQTQ